MAETPNDKPKVNVLLSSTFTLFNRKLAVVYEKKGDNSQSFLLIPTKTDYDGITLKEMTDGIINLFGDPNADIKQLTDKIPEGKANDVRFYLTMAYLYFESTEDAKAKTSTQKNVEFAFQVKVTGLDNLLPSKVGAFTFSDVQFAIWSTKRDKIIEEMHLITPDDFKNN